MELPPPLFFGGGVIEEMEEKIMKSRLKLKVKELSLPVDLPKIYIHVPEFEASYTDYKSTDIYIKFI